MSVKEQPYKRRDHKILRESFHRVQQYLDWKRQGVPTTPELDKEFNHAWRQQGQLLYSLAIREPRITDAARAEALRDIATVYDLDEEGKPRSTRNVCVV